MNVRPANLRLGKLHTTHRNLNRTSPTTQSSGSANAYERDRSANDKHEHAHFRHGNAACVLWGTSNDPTTANSNCNKEKDKFQRKSLQVL